MSTGQADPRDLEVPKGMLRIIREEVLSGKLWIAAEFYKRDLAIIGLRAYRENKCHDQFTLYDENGVVKA